MKSVFAIVLFLSSFSFAGELLKYSYSVMFSPDPFLETIVLHDDGKVIQTVEYQTSKKYLEIQLAEISPIVLQKIHAKILKTDVNAALVDKNPDAPHCMDGPILAIFVNKNGQQTMIHKDNECHTYDLDDYSANSLSQVMMGLVALSRL
jgi:hypothetical protein